MAELICNIPLAAVDAACISVAGAAKSAAGVPVAAAVPVAAVPAAAVDLPPDSVSFCRF